MQRGRKIIILMLTIGLMIQGPIAALSIEQMTSDIDSAELALENYEYDDDDHDEDDDDDHDDEDDDDDHDDDSDDDDDDSDDDDDDSDDDDDDSDDDDDLDDDQDDTDEDDEEDSDQPEEEELDEDLEDLCPVEELPSPGDVDDIPEFLSAEDMLEYVPVPEECIEIASRSSATPGGTGSGVVQFVLEPIQSSLPNGVTMTQARNAAMNTSAVYHILHPNATSNDTATAVNGRFGRDAIYLGQSANGSRFKIMIGGFVGYVPRKGRRVTLPAGENSTGRQFDVRVNAVFVPFSNYPKNTGSSTVRSTSHYVNQGGELRRVLTNNVTTAAYGGQFMAGPAPSWMKQNTRYYSYDGVYFYTNPRNIRANGSGAVNASNPHFNYFQYLSFRSESTVTASQLNNFLTNQSLHGLNTSNSVMRNQGNAFINAQNHYGANALLMYAKAMHESAGGTSAIARNNNNLFGQGAIDVAPGQNAWHFATPAASVNDLADGWISRGYLWPGNWTYEGPHVGHKGSGMNVRYATDPYWGEKIAGWAFRIDRSRPSASRDRNREQIAIRRNTSTVSVQNNAGTRLYTANPSGGRYSPFLVTGTSGNRLRVLTDPAIVSGKTNRTARYNRSNAVGFIPNTNVWLTGASKPRATGSSSGTTANHKVTTVRRPGVIRRKTAFRQGPGSSYGRIRNVSANTNVRITGQSGSWYRVRHNGTTGWMRKNDVSLTNQYAVVTANNAHVRSGRGTNHRSLTRVPRGKRVTVKRQTSNWSRITVNGHTGWIRNRDISTTSAMRPGRTKSNNVSVRSRPTSGARVVRKLPRNSQLMVLQRTTNGWSQIRIRHNGGTINGWVRTSQIQTRNQSRRMSQAGTLRSGPGTNFRSLRVMPRNTKVTIRARVGKWYHVHANVNGRKVTGWQHQDNIRRLPQP